ncbi:hypothetical protein N0V82_007035 [Gnomoniopsis sp. IMI 355080]|nr:hypothetical protein N0V82_007035 [Gnomoniopsis sp. IMI 355080]
MEPIRLGIIGLSSSAVTSWASSAHLPYLTSPRGLAKYRIVALCNSSVESAKAAIKTFRLDPATTKAYGDPTAMSRDPDIDLVVCCTRVDTHYAVTKPSIEAGKAAFVEWPLTHDVERSRELAELAAKKGSRSMVGLQGQLTPVILKIKELLQDGSIGKVLSSEVRAHGGTNDRERVAEGLRYFTDIKIGGNIFMIGFAHLFDYVQSVLGEATGLQSSLQLQRPKVQLRDGSGHVVDTVLSNVPDLVMVTGALSGSQLTQEGASLQVRFRRGQQFKGEPALTWHINGELGELRLTAPAGTSLHASSYSEPVVIEIHDFATDEVRTVNWEWPKWQDQDSLPIVSRSVARLYETYYENIRKGAPQDYPDFSSALRRHEQLQSILSEWELRH